MALLREDLLSEPFVDAIKKFEGLRLTPYKCAAGYMTVGYGHRCEDNQQPITQAQADALLLEDLQQVYDGLKSVVPYMVEDKNIPSYRAGALISWVFNLGIGSLKKSSLKRRLDEGNWHEASHEILRWDKITDPITKKKRVLKGLQRRRLAEHYYFVSGELPVFRGSLK